MDEAAAHRYGWHEDDVLHQAEGMLSARLAITVDEATEALQTYAAAEGVSPRDVAPHVIDGSVDITP
jgi:hypothetical protein